VLQQEVLIYSIYVFLEGKDVVAENDEFIGVENWRMRIAARARPKKEVSISLYFAN
jgi:hypothetical protein